MKGSKSFTFSTLPPQYRSSEGRRLPFHELLEGEHIDDGTLLDYESMPFVLLLAYETDGTPSFEAVGEWSSAHERLMEWFYDSSSPCLVDPVRPNQHIDFLDERSTAARLRGRQAVFGQALAIWSRLAASDFKVTVVEPWKALSSVKKTNVVLETLGARARNSEANNSYCFVRDRKLVPEFSVASLCADEGDGLVRLFDAIRDFVSNPSQLFTNPLVNDRFFRKFGVPHSGTDVPLSKADRAMQEEYVLRRLSLLLSLTESLCSALAGEAPITYIAVGNYASDFTRASRPVPRRDEEGNEWPTEFEEPCSRCRRNASESKVKKLTYCGRCRSVGRNQLYCSTDCQRSDWKYHKTTGGCGIKLSDLDSVPIIANNISASSKSPTDQLIKSPSVEKIIQDFIKSNKAARRRRDYAGTKDEEDFNVEARLSEENGGMAEDDENNVHEKESPSGRKQGVGKK